MKEFEWTFGTCGYIDIKRTAAVNNCIHFNYDDNLRMHVVWTVESFTEEEWDQVLACVKEAKAVLKRIKRI